MLIRLDKAHALRNSRSMDEKHSVSDILAGRAPNGRAGHRQGLGAHPARLQGRHLVRALSDGSCVPSGAGGRAEHARQLHRRGRCKLTAGCAVEATGTIVPSPAKGQPFEMQASAIQVIGWVDDPDTYPIQPKPHTLEFLREVAHLRPRTNVIGAATRVRHTLAQAIHRFFDQHGFFWVNTPIITASDAEGAGELFRVSTLDLANLPRDARGQGRFRARISSAARRSSPCRGSSTSRPTAWRSRRSTPSGRRSAPRTRTPAGTSPSSG